MKKQLAIVGLMVVVGATGLFLYVAQDASATVPGTNTLVSLNSAGTAAANERSGSTGFTLLAANGKFVAFTSNATNITSSGGAGFFMRNLSTGVVTRLNVSTSGTVADATVYPQAISATGRYVLFNSTASNLIDGTTITTSNPQVYMRDTVAGVTTLISKNSSGTIANNYAEGYDVSSDGRFVLFSSYATNLHTDGTSGYYNLYMFDTSDSSLTLLNRKSDGTVATGNATWKTLGHMSCDGSLVVIQTPVNLVVGGTNNNYMNVYLIDRRAGNKITNLTVAANGASIDPSISCNGDYIGFASYADNLDTTVSFTKSDTQRHAYVYDRVSGVFYVADRSASTGDVSSGVNCSSTGVYSCVAVSDTGVALFGANKSSLTGVTGNHIYLRNTNASTTELLTRNSGGTPANGSSSSGYTPAISRDGELSAYHSLATNLVATSDSNGLSDVFVSLTGN